MLKLMAFLLVSSSLLSAAVVPSYPLNAVLRDSADASVVTDGKLYLKIPVPTGKIAAGAAMQSATDALYTTVDSAVTYANGVYVFAGRHSAGTYLISVMTGKHLQKDTLVALSAIADNGSFTVLIKLTKMTFCRMSGTITKQCITDLCSPAAVDSCLVTVTLQSGIPAKKSSAVLQAYSTYSDKTGYYLIDNIPASDAKQPIVLTIAKTGYQTIVQHDSITSGNIQINLPMPPGPTEVRSTFQKGARSVLIATIRNRSLILDIAAEGFVSVDLYGLDGKLIEAPVKSVLLSSGIHSFPLERSLAGDRMLVAKIASNGNAVTESIIPEK